MNDSIKRISLDIHNAGSGETVNAKRGDTARKIIVSLVDGGLPYIIGEDCDAVFTAKKPDGKVVYNDCTIKDNTIIYKFTEQTVAVEGKVNCEIKLYGADDKLITSPKFTIVVFGTVYNEGDEVESSYEFSALTKLVSDTIEVNEAAIEATEAANIATESANESAKNANEATKAANEAALSAKASAETATNATGVATQAAQNATEAAALAENEAARANLAAQLADDMASAAEAATSGALQAAGEANAAADKAIRASAACMVIGKATGENIYLGDAIEQNFVGCRIFGRTTQDGTPTPDAPVDLVSVGDSGSITVNVAGANEAQSMTVATPNGLPGIPVTSGGNYTDANGQQWICDEIDFARGVYVQRVNLLILTGSEEWLEYEYAPQYYGFFVGDLLESGQNRAFGLCNQFSVAKLTDGSVWIGVSSNTALYVITREWHDKGINAWRSHLSTNPLRIMYSRSTPIETPLSEEDLAAYAALHTYKNHTTVSNDAGAYMELEYVMDAKKYIDSQISTGIIEARVG